nr:glycoside hydrolase family 2 TIM barrel-domain containing protein [uncultured Porphyromonas sp.]
MRKDPTKILRMGALSLALLAFAGEGGAQSLMPSYSYARQEAPQGDEWQSPERYALNKERPHAYFFSFAKGDQVTRVLPEHSSLHQSLDGKWRFHWVRTPEERPKDFYLPTFDISSWDEVTVPMNWNVYGLQRDGKQKYGTPIYVNQPVIFYHQVKPGDWKGGVMRTPPKDWTTYRDRNEVGSYRRTFTLPEGWKGHSVYLNFDGVDSFFYLWINGRYVGFSKNSRNLASFDISPYLNARGENTLAVEVYRSSDGSFLEAQDMFRLPGIFRSVYLTAKPQTQLRDLQVIPRCDSRTKEWSLDITSEITSQILANKVPQGILRYRLYRVELYSDNVASVPDAVTEVRLPLGGSTKANLIVSQPRLWSAEQPNRYVLVAELYDKSGKKLLDQASLYTGLRQVEIRDTEAKDDEFGRKGRYFYVNDCPVKLKGTNRHETNPERGHAITHEQMEQEVFLMKRANINHVRNSHYPPAPYWYYLCDKYGIYLEDEANIESHEYYYGKASLSHVPEFEAQHVSRMLEMVYANINHPSIVIWSLGNEAGPGENFVKSYRATKAVDTTRPIQYERNNDIVDMGSNQYPSIGWVEGAAEGKYKIKYPFHISEYAHSMGNACGGLSDYWKAIERTNFICGGAIWDWVDQAIYNYTPDGKRYLAYGGDFGDTPNDGMFVMNGIVFADLQPKPQYYEVKKVFQNVGFSLEGSEGRTLKIFNKNYFTTLDDYTLRLSLWRDGIKVEESMASMPTIAPRASAEVELPESYAKRTPGSEYFVKAECVLSVDKPWAKTGYVQMDEQLPLPSIEPKAQLEFATASPFASAKTIGDKWVATGKDFDVAFDLKQGTISRLVYSGDTLIREGNEPRLTAFRAPCDNDVWIRSQWVANGLHNLHHKVLSHKITPLPGGRVELYFTVRSQAPNGATLTMKKASGHYQITEDTSHPFGEEDFHFISEVVWTVHSDGKITLRSNISNNKPHLTLARLGYEFVLPKQYEDYTYYGRGPINNYGDRKASQYIEQHQSKVAEQFISFPKPQTMANREDVRWVSLTKPSGSGILFYTDSVMTSSALPYSALDLMFAPHPYQLPAPGDTHLVLSLSTTGLGGRSCGQGPPLKQYQSFGTPQIFTLTLRPFNQGDEVSVLTREQPEGTVVPAITRSMTGDLSLTSVQDAQLMYSIGKGKAQRYTAPIPFVSGGTVHAWDARYPGRVATRQFPKIEYTAATVTFCSSEDTEYECQATNLLDGKPETIWHSMWSVTVTKHPHWIDFDILKPKTVRGITYLPRQDDSSTGDIKDFIISVSQDGKNWTEVLRSAFPKDKKEQRILLTKPVTARYVRLTALTAQDGTDYASGSELRILAD